MTQIEDLECEIKIQKLKNALKYEKEKDTITFLIIKALEITTNPISLILWFVAFVLGIVVGKP